MHLFYAPTSPYARIIRLALHRIGLFDHVSQELATLRDPDSILLPHNPVGRVPTLRLDNGVALTETLVILTHLDTLHAGPRLLPLASADGGAALARLGRVMGLLDGIAVWNRELRRPEHERSPGVIALETTRAGRVLDRLEGEIGAAAWQTAEDASALALSAALGYCELRHPACAWRPGRPGLAAWFDARATSEGFRRTAPD
jgi:glutathione S-transferase